MFYFFIQCIRVFGLQVGIRAYLNIKVFKTGSITLGKSTQTVFFRPRTIDVHTFREIFLREEYNITLPDGFSVNTIIDAGANIGFTTLYFSRRFPLARIYSFEPDAENFALLKKNTNPHTNIVPAQKAIWKNTGFIKITDKGYGVRGFMVEDAQPDTHHNVFEAISLTDLIGKNNFTSIDILKMDIEGSEKEVFEADTSWLSITRCLIIELHDRMKPGCSTAAFKALSGYNFECSIKGENLVFINRDLVPY